MRTANFPSDALKRISSKARMASSKSRAVSSKSGHVKITQILENADALIAIKDI